MKQARIPPPPLPLQEGRFESQDPTGFPPAESPREDPDEYALETRAALFATKAVAVETVEREAGFTRKLSGRSCSGSRKRLSQRTEPEPPRRNSRKCTTR